MRSSDWTDTHKKKSFLFIQFIFLSSSLSKYCYCCWKWSCDHQIRIIFLISFLFISQNIFDVRWHGDKYRLRRMTSVRCNRTSSANRINPLSIKGTAENFDRIFSELWWFRYNFELLSASGWTHAKPIPLTFTFRMEYLATRCPLCDKQKKKQLLCLSFQRKSLAHCRLAIHVEVPDLTPNTKEKTRSFADLT